MRRLLALAILAFSVAGLVVGCAKVEDKVVVTVTDNEGTVEPRTLTVGYINERLDRMPPDMVPSTPGDEGRREFIEDIIRKELLVIYGTRIGILEDERLPGALEYFENSKAEEMLRDELINEPASVTPEEVEDYYAVRDATFQLQEIIVPTEEQARDIYQRVTTGGEDFGRIAVNESRGPTAADEGRKGVIVWRDLHPLQRVAVRYLDKDQVSEPFKINENWNILKVLSRKPATNMKPLEGDHLHGITQEARNFNRNILEYELFTEWMEASRPVFYDEAMDVCGTRIDEARAIVLPEGQEPTTMEERMEQARASVIPQFSEEEAGMVLCTYNIGGEDKTVTLADYARLSGEVPGIETVKTGDRIRIESFMKRIIQREIMENKIQQRGYRDTQEMKDYLAERTEEFIVDITYDQEVVRKVEEPTGQEIRDYYREHKGDFMEPAGVDVQQIIVATEAQANLIRQRIEAGEATFTEMVRTHSIEDWSKAKDGIIEKYLQGERRLDYLQGVAFDLEIGEVSEPFRAPGGYALIKVLKTYPERQHTFDEVHGIVYQSLVAMAREAKLNALLAEIRGTVTVDYDDDNLQYVKDPVVALEEKESQRRVITTELG